MTGLQDVRLNVHGVAALTQANSAMYARDITVHCPFLVVNKTHMALRVIDTAPLAETPSIAPPLPEDNIAQPMLFRCLMSS